MTHLQAFRTLVKGREGMIVLILASMLAEAAFDCLGLGMFVPLLSSLQGGAEQARSFPIAGRVLAAFPGREPVAVMAGLLLALFVVKNAVKYASDLLQAVFLWELRRSWWERISWAYLRAPYRTLVGQETGVLVSNLVTEPSYCVKAFLSALNFASAAVLVASYYCALLYFSWKATLAMTVLAGAFLAASRLVLVPLSRRVGQARLERHQRFTQQAMETIHGVLQIKLYAMEDAVHDGIRRNLRELNRHIRVYEMLRNMPGPLMETALVVFLAGALAWMASSRPGEIAQLVPWIGGFVLLAQRLFSQASILANGHVEWATTLPSLERIAALIDEPETEDLDAGAPPPRLRSGLRLEGVRFAYPGKEPCLAGVDLEIPAGAVTAVFGPSGTGKSTLVSLISGVYRDYEGRILADGAELRELRLRDWRRRVAYISQDNHVFAGTVLDNILLGDPSKGEDEAREAARAAGADEFVSRLPEGYRTPLGDRGLQLSAGQRQRLILARALLRRPDLFILDEATNALDAESEAVVRETVLRLARREGRAVVLISHSDSWARHADRCYRLADGRADLVEPAVREAA